MNSYRSIILAAYLASVTSIVSGCGKDDPNERANALFVETTQNFRNASTMPYDAAIEEYQNGLASLDQITTRYPGSTLAVQLVSQQQIGNFRLELRKMRSGSMKPTIQLDEEIFIVKSDVSPQHGDIVIYLLPRDRTTEYIHRVIGLPGDRVQMINGALQLNGQPIRQEKVSDFVDNTNGGGERVRRWRETMPGGASYYTLDLQDNGFLDNTQVYIVPANFLFVMGDNRDNSTDSRVLSAVGYVPFGNVIGRVVPKRH